MTMTASKGNKGKKKITPEAITQEENLTSAEKLAASIKPEEHLDVVVSFTSDCLEVEFQKSSGLPTAKKASKSATQKVAEEADGDEDAFGVVKKLLRAKLPIIDEVNGWKRTIDEVRNKFTFSIASSAKATNQEVKKAKGKRLIRKDDVALFEECMVDLEVKGNLISKKLYEEYDVIMAVEKKRLGTEFRADDYPTKESIYREETVEAPDANGNTVKMLKKSGALSIGNRVYTEVVAPVSLPESVQKRMMSQTYERLNDTVEVIIADITKTLVDNFTVLADELTEKIIVMPRYGTEGYKKIGHEGELIATRTHADDVNIPEGKNIYTIKWSVGKSRTKTQTDFGPMTEEEFKNDFRPEEAEVGSGIHTSVVVKFENYLNQFSNLKSKLGVYGEKMDEALDVLRDLHHVATTGSHKKGTEGLVDTLKYSGTFRKKMRTALLDIKEKAEHVAGAAKEVRRSVSGSIASRLAKMKKK